MPYAFHKSCLWLQAPRLGNLLAQDQCVSYRMFFRKRVGVGVALRRQSSNNDARPY